MKFLLFFFFPVLAFSQNIYSGKIINDKTGEGIAYATIALIRANTGTNADENGKFFLPLNGYLRDTIAVSCVGYQMLKTPINKLPIDSLFKLTPLTITIKDVIVKANKTEHIIEANAFSGTGSHSRVISNYEMQIAQPLQSPRENARLMAVCIAKRHGNALFRLRIYREDTFSKQPLEDLADTIIQVSSKKSQVDIDLKKYNIYLPKGRFFVAVEWLKIPFNAFSSTTSFQGKKAKLTAYMPELFVNKEKVTTELDLPWCKNYDGKWERDVFRKSFRISATIAY